MTHWRWFAGVGGIVLIGVAFWGMSPHHQPLPERRTRCSDFRTQAEAQQAFKAGAVWLDANRDNVACNALLGR